jgi:DNA processing protein
MSTSLLSAPDEFRVYPQDPRWPPQLRALPDPPAMLRVRGQLPTWAGAVAVVGTRAADDDALEFARNLGAAIGAAGRAVVSGGARGIDAAAHRGALDVGGPTVAVLANGFDPPFPPDHVQLFAQIAENGGGLISEREDGGPPERWTFLARNRLIAALVEVVVVVQAPLRSGALSTAAVARKLEKRVLTVPYAPWEARGKGCLELLRLGAQICTSPRDVLSKPAYGAAAVSQTVQRHEENPMHVDGLDEDGRAVWGALGQRARHPDDLAASLGLPVMRIQRSLLQLLLQGLAVERAGGRYARNVEPEQR